MVVKFNVKKDVLLGAVRKAAGSWIRTKEMALSVKSDGQGITRCVCRVMVYMLPDAHFLLRQWEQKVKLLL